MEVYQPLNTYSFCRTKHKDNIEVNHTNTVKLIHSKVHKNKMIYKLVISIVVVCFVVAASVFMKIEASAPISYEAAQGETKIVVGTGDTLWKLASTHYPDIDDTGFAIYLIKERNGLSGTIIHPGQTIILPELK